MAEIVVEMKKIMAEIVSEVGQVDCVGGQVKAHGGGGGGRGGGRGRRRQFW